MQAPLHDPANAPEMTQYQRDATFKDILTLIDTDGANSLMLSTAPGIPMPATNTSRDVGGTTSLPMPSLPNALRGFGDLFAVDTREDEKDETTEFANQVTEKSVSSIKRGKSQKITICYKCGKSEETVVISLGGSTHGERAYYWDCVRCGSYQGKVPAETTNENLQTMTLEPTNRCVPGMNMQSRSHKKGGYKCPQCGQPKKGHICPNDPDNQQKTTEREAAITTLAPLSGGHQPIDAITSAKLALMSAQQAMHPNVVVAISSKLDAKLPMASVSKKHTIKIKPSPLKKKARLEKARLVDDEDEEDDDDEDDDEEDDDEEDEEADDEATRPTGRRKGRTALKDDDDEEDDEEEDQDRSDDDEIADIQAKQTDAINDGVKLLLSINGDITVMRASLNKMLKKKGHGPAIIANLMPTIFDAFRKEQKKTIASAPKSKRPTASKPKSSAPSRKSTVSQTHYVESNTKLTAADMRKRGICEVGQSGTTFIYRSQKPSLSSVKAKPQQPFAMRTPTAVASIAPLPAGHFEVRRGSTTDDSPCGEISWIMKRSEQQQFQREVDVYLSGHTAKTGDTKFQTMDDAKSAALHDKQASGIVFIPTERKDFSSAMVGFYSPGYAKSAKKGAIHYSTLHEALDACQDDDSANAVTRESTAKYTLRTSGMEQKMISPTSEISWFKLKPSIDFSFYRYDSNPDGPGVYNMEEVISFYTSAAAGKQRVSRVKAINKFNKMPISTKIHFCCDCSARNPTDPFACDKCNQQCCGSCVAKKSGVSIDELPDAWLCSECDQVSEEGEPTEEEEDEEESSTAVEQAATESSDAVEQAAASSLEKYDSDEESKQPCECCGVVETDKKTLMQCSCGVVAHIACAKQYELIVKGKYMCNECQCNTLTSQ